MNNILLFPDGERKRGARATMEFFMVISLRFFARSWRFFALLS